MSVKAHVKRALLRTGALGALHRARNRNTLTVITLHRILAADDPRAAEADPRYTLDRALFASVLDFLGRHYNPVCTADVLAALDGGAPLPPRALLMTLDDGWADNLDHAVPELDAAGWPAIVFVAGCAVDAAVPFWPEQVVAAHRAGRLDPDDLRCAWRVVAPGESAPSFATLDGVRALNRRLRESEPTERDRALAELPGLTDTVGGELVTGEQLLRLSAAVELGGHGEQHEPLPALADLDAELSGGRRRLQALSGAPVAAVSFPHGRYDERVVAAADAAGYRLQFTSDGMLNATPGGRPLGGLLHRIGIYADDITQPDGTLAPELLALWLFRRRAATPPRSATSPGSSTPAGAIA